MATYTAVNIAYTNNCKTKANITDQNVVSGKWIKYLDTPVASNGGQTSGALSGQQVEGSFVVRFLGGAQFLAKFKIATDMTVTISSAPPSAMGITMVMSYTIVNNTVSVNLHSTEE